MLKSIAAVTAAIALTACSGSPIKQINCNDEQGEYLTGAIYDSEKRIVYVYDHFIEALKPYSSDTFDEAEAIVTNSGKIKKREVMGNYVRLGDETEYLTVIDTKKLTAEVEKHDRESKLKLGSSRAVIEHNNRVIATEDSTLKRTTTTRTGTCKFVKPWSTTVAGE